VFPQFSILPQPVEATLIAASTFDRKETGFASGSARMPSDQTTEKRPGFGTGLYIASPRAASVDHSTGQYVVRAIHTNTSEGFWSLVKRGVVGTFHKVSPKYLPLYVAEFCFKYNNRENEDIFGAAIGGR
jgi:hypothetical protein